LPPTDAGKPLHMKNKMKNKKGVSPVVATVLLISMVVILAMIVILWFTSFIGEAITKFDGQNVEIICKDITFDASYLGNILSVVNTGSVPIYGMKVKQTKGGEHSSVDAPSWPSKGLNPGKSYASSASYSSYDKITLIPVLVGESESGLKTFVCEEKQAGKEIII
jgi:flagellin-like protein